MIPEIIKQYQKVGGACFLCREHTHDVALFIAEPGSVYASPNDEKTRSYIYNLCDKCCEKVDECENKLLQEITMGRLKII